MHSLLTLCQLVTRICHHDLFSCNIFPQCTIKTGPCGSSAQSPYAHSKLARLTTFRYALQKHIGVCIVDASSVFRQVQYRAQQALDLAFPPQCASCKRVGTILCAACFAQLAPATPLPYKQGWQALQGLVAVNVYQGPLRNCIHALKYDGVIRLAEPLGALLAQIYLDYGMQADMLVSVPLHSERHKQRGYNHAHLLASACASHIGVSLRDDVLVRSRATNVQVGLNAYDRKQNVAGAFSVSSNYTTTGMYGRRIIIVDDVCTTGATLDACAATLFQAGAVSVWGLVLAGSAL